MHSIMNRGIDLERPLVARSDEPPAVAAKVPFVRLASDGQGGMAELLQLLDAQGAEAGVGMDIPVPVRRLHEGDTLFHEGATAEGIYFCLLYTSPSPRD